MYVYIQDLCWYYAQKTDHPEEKGVIPVTHVTCQMMVSKFVVLFHGSYSRSVCSVVNKD